MVLLLGRPTHSYSNVFVAPKPLPIGRSQCVFEGRRRIRQLVHVRARVRRDQLPRGHLVLRCVDAVERDELAGAQITHAKAARSRRAARDHGVVPLTDAHDDEFEIVLIGPEPRHFVVARRSTEQVVADCRALLEGIIDGFESQTPAVVSARMVGTVARSPDRLVGRATALIGDDAILAVESGSRRNLIGRQHADTDDNEVSRMLGPGFRQHRAHATRAGIAGERAYLLVAENAYTVARVLGLIKGGQQAAGHAVHDAVGHLEHDHLEPELARARSDLEADVAAADDHQSPTGRTMRANAVGIGDRSQVVHAGELAAGNRQGTRPAARREYQCVVLDQSAVIEPHALLAAQYLADAPPAQYLHAVLAVVLGWSQQQPVTLERTGQILLGERWALIGKPRLIAHQAQLSREALAA